MKAKRIFDAPALCRGLLLLEYAALPLPRIAGLIFHAAREGLLGELPGH